MSTLMIIIVSLVYTTFILTLTRIIGGHLAWRWLERHNAHPYNISSQCQEPGGDQWFGAYCLALLIAFCWPVLIIPALTGRKFKVGAELRGEKHTLQARITELEHELDKENGL